MKSIVNKTSNQTLNEIKFEEQLLQNYEFYKSAFELSKDPKLVLEDCVIIRFNPITMSFFECDNPNFLFQHKLSEFLPGNLTEDGVIKNKCEGNILIETKILTCSNKWIPVTINFDTIRKNGKMRTIATIHNISEIIEARKNLEEGQEFIYKVMDNLPIGIGVKSIGNKTVKYMNENFCKIWGWPKSIVSDFDLFFEKVYPKPGEAEHVKAMVLQALAKENFAHWEMVKILDESGNDRIIDITMFLLPDQDSMVTMIQNVTQEVKDRAWLKVKSEAVKALPHGIVITDKDGRILWVNPAFVKEYGWELSEIKGHTPRILKSDEYNSEFYSNMWDTILSGRIWKGKIVNKRKDGSILEDRQIIAPVRAGGAEITHFIAIKNLTEQELDYNAK